MKTNFIERTNRGRVKFACTWLICRKVFVTRYNRVMLIGIVHYFRSIRPTCVPCDDPRVLEVHLPVNVKAALRYIVDKKHDAADNNPIVEGKIPSMWWELAPSSELARKIALSPDEAKRKDDNNAVGREYDLIDKLVHERNLNRMTSIMREIPLITSRGLSYAEYLLKEINDNNNCNNDVYPKGNSMRTLNSYMSTDSAVERAIVNTPYVIAEEEDLTPIPTPTFESGDTPILAPTLENGDTTLTEPVAELDSNDGYRKVRIKKPKKNNK